MSVAAALLIAADLPEHPSTLQLLWFALTGMLVVLLSLSLIAVFCSALGYLVRIFVPRPLASRSVTPANDHETSDELIAVIAAAVAEAIDAPHRIVNIRGLTPEDLTWSLEGRLQHHASHVPPRPRR